MQRAPAFALRTVFDFHRGSSVRALPFGKRNVQRIAARVRVKLALQGGIVCERFKIVQCFRRAVIGNSALFELFARVLRMQRVRTDGNVVYQHFRRGACVEVEPKAHDARHVPNAVAAARVFKRGEGDGNVTGLACIERKSRRPALIAAFADGNLQSTFRSGNPQADTRRAAPILFVGGVDGLHCRPSSSFGGVGKFHCGAIVGAFALGKRGHERIAARMRREKALQLVIVFKIFKVVDDARYRVVGYRCFMVCLRREGGARIRQRDIFSVLFLHCKNAHIILCGILERRADRRMRPLRALFRGDRGKVCTFGELNEIFFGIRLLRPADTRIYVFIRRIERGSGDLELPERNAARFHFHLRRRAFSARGKQHTEREQDAEKCSKQSSLFHFLFPLMLSCR